MYFVFRIPLQPFCDTLIVFFLPFLSISLFHFLFSTMHDDEMLGFHSVSSSESQKVRRHLLFTVYHSPRHHFAPVSINHYVR